MEKSLQRANVQAASLGASLRRAFILLGGGTLLIRGIRTLASFDQAMSTVKAVTKATAEEFSNLRQEARDLGITTRFTATQAADAMVKLARAGFSVSEALAATSDTLLLAQSGGLGLAQAADIAASTLRGFRLEVVEMGRVTDVLVKSANSANTTVAQMGEGLKFVAPIAAGLGVSLETTTAAMGSLADAGLKATLAGTGLRRIFAELEAPVQRTKDILASLGLETKDVAISQVGLVGALKALQAAGVDTGLALQIFKQRGGPAFEVLVNNIPRIEEMTDALGRSAGEARAVAEIMDDNLNGALLRARSAMEGFLLAAGDTGATDDLIRSLSGVTNGFRFLARNAENALAVLQTVAITGLVHALIPALVRTIPLLATVTSGVGLLGKSFFIMGAAAAAVTVVLFRRLSKSLAEVKKSQDAVVEAARFNQLGAAINQNIKQINQLRRARRRLGKLSEGQTARLKELIDKTDKATDAVRAQAESVQKLAAVRKAAEPSVKNTLAGLDRQITLLGLSNRESEIQLQIQEKVDRLLQAGVIPGEAEKKTIELRLRTIQALEDQRRVLEEIQGPQDQMKRDIAAIDGLLAEGIITGEQYRAKLAEIRDETEQGFSTASLDEQVQALKESNALLGIRIDLGRDREELERRILELKKSGEVRDTTSDQKARADLQAQFTIRSQLLEKEKAQNEEKRLAARLVKQEERRVESLTRQLDMVGQLAEKERLLNEVLMRRPDLANEVAVAQEELMLRSLEASTALEDGFTRAFIKIRQEAEDLASVGEDVVGVFANNATDALAEFAQEGKINMKELANAVIDDLIRIIARLLVVQALSAAFGGGGAGGLPGGVPFLPFDTGTGKEDGGTVQPGRSYLVGEKGKPEMLTPGRTGAITPLVGNQEPPQVNLQVVNVQSEDDIPNALDSGKSDDAILNLIARNASKVKQVIE